MAVQPVASNPPPPPPEAREAQAPPREAPKAPTQDQVILSVEAQQRARAEADRRAADDQARQQAQVAQTASRVDFTA